MKKFLRLFKTMLFGSASSRINALVRIMQRANARGHAGLASLCSRRLESFGLFISSQAKLSDGLKLPHPVSIVVGQGVEVGRNVTIYQGVTLGGRVIGDWKIGNYPTIGENTVIFCGAVIVGKVKVGRNCVIGANSVVTSDIPDNATAVGAPARVVKVRAAEYEISASNG